MKQAALGLAFGLLARAPLAASEPAPHSAPVTVDAVYTADIWRAEGGAAEGWRYLDNLDLTLEADLDRLAGLPRTRAFAYVLYNNGASLSELSGDAFVASNIETGTRALRLYEAWIEHGFTDAASLRVGLYDLNSEFDALEASALFLGSAHGIGVDLSQSGENGPSIFPVTSLAARLSVAATPRLTLRAAVLDAVPGDPDRPARTAVRLGDGALGIAEADWRIGAARLLAGAWRYSRAQPRLDGTGRGRSSGLYLRGEACLMARAECRLAAFARAGIADADTNAFEAFLAGGLTANLDDDWQAGLAIAHGLAGTPQRRAVPAFGNETVVEATVAHRPTAWLTLQPSLQLIRSAHLSGEREAAALGLRITIAPLALRGHD